MSLLLLLNDDEATPSECFFDAAFFDPAFFDVCVPATTGRGRQAYQQQPIIDPYYDDEELLIVEAA